MTRGSTSTLVDRFAHWAVVGSLTLACGSLVTIDAIVRPSSVQFSSARFAHWAVVSSLTLACERLVTINAIVRPSSVQLPHVHAPHAPRVHHSGVVWGAAG
jgi:hypothetical protein